MALEGVNRLTLREQAWATLRTAILDGSLKAGSRLGEADLAERLGVSRGTVREALRLLQQSGLVAGEDRVGLHVATFSPREIVELYDVRGALESQAAFRVVTSGEYGRVADELDALLPALDASMPISERLDVDLRFHEALCRASGNAVLLEMWRTLQDRMRVSVLANYRPGEDELLGRDYHTPIVEAIRSGDATRARDAIMAHMANSGASWARSAQSRMD
ncbi:MAG: GntR family transcriptional regulator [Schaalia georgiae]|uniref:GntR family transcriptional regulator n=1 Tax=Schaalia georgiae TaxID=52768 RepID=A0A929N0P3_9ACTO|nr:GntR family transcriptional regulator [Schaalia georgiae]